MSSAPLIGSGDALRADPLGLLLRAADIAPVCKIQQQGKDAYVLSAPEDVHALLVQDGATVAKTPRYRRATRFLGRGLLWAEGQAHQRQRGALTPCFSPRAVQSYAAAILRHSEEAARNWHHGASVDVLQSMLRLNVSIVTESLLGQLSDADVDTIVSAVQEVDALLEARLGGDSSLARTSWRAWRARAAVRQIEGLLRRLRQSGVASAQCSGQLLSRASRERIRDAGSSVRDEAVGLLVACQDTTPYVLAWCLHLLAQQSETARAVQREARQCTALSAAGAAELPLALAVFKETLRLYPPAYMTMRQARTSLDVGGVTLSPGSNLIFNIYGIQRRPDLFSEPEEFRPQRWGDGFEQTLPRGAYIPFIAGPRRCIGSHFALMEGQLVLASLLRQVGFGATRQGLRPRAALTLRPPKGHRLTVTRGDPTT